MSTYFEYASERQHEAGAGTYEEDSGDVEAKCDGGIRKEYKGANSCKREDRCETLCEGEDGEVNDGADGRVIVE